MPKPAIDYRRLTGRRRTPAGSSEIWLAQDHLLLVLRHWWTESYQRFRLNDIRSIVIVERPSWRGLQIVGLAATAILLALTILALHVVARKILLGVPLSVALIWQLTDFLRGPYCRVELATAVSTVRLAPLRRMRTAVRFAAEVTPLIEAVQGQWTPEPPPLPEPTTAGNERLEGWQMSGAAPSPASVRRLPPPLPPRAASHVAPLILFVATLLLGLVLTGTRGQVPQQLASWLWMVGMLPVILGAIVAISGRGALIRILAGGSAIASLIFDVGSLITFIKVASEAAKNRVDPAETAAYVASQVRYGERPGWALIAIGLLGLGLTLAAWLNATQAAEDAEAQ